MTIPFPYNATAGVSDDPVRAEVRALFPNLGWIARLSQEISVEDSLNLKRVFQLVFHMRKFRAVLAKLDARRQREGVSEDPDWPFIRPVGEVGSILRGELQTWKMTWASQGAMLTDLNALNTNCGTFADWIAANQGEYKNGYTTGTVIGQDADGIDVISDEAISIPKPAAFQTRVLALRANFTA